jgi:ribonucleotide reductase alpha subunit
LNVRRIAEHTWTRADDVIDFSPGTTVTEVARLAHRRRAMPTGAENAQEVLAGALCP